MTEAPLDLSLEPQASSATVIVARQRRALVDSLVGSRRGGPRAGSTSGRDVAPAQASCRTGSSNGAAARGPTPVTLRLDLENALVVPAGALLRGYLRARALLLAGEIVGNVHCIAGPVVIRAGGCLKGRLVAAGDVYVCGHVSDSGGGAVISTRGKLTLAPGARVDGDVRSGHLELHEGALLCGVARAFED